MAAPPTKGGGRPAPPRRKFWNEQHHTQRSSGKQHQPKGGGQGSTTPKGRGGKNAKTEKGRGKQHHPKIGVTTTLLHCNFHCVTFNLLSLSRQRKEEAAAPHKRRRDGEVEEEGKQDHPQRERERESKHHQSKEEWRKRNRTTQKEKGTIERLRARFPLWKLVAAGFHWVLFNIAAILSMVQSQKTCATGVMPAKTRRNAKPDDSAAPRQDNDSIRKQVTRRDDYRKRETSHFRRIYSPRRERHSAVQCSP